VDHWYIPSGVTRAFSIDVRVVLGSFDSSVHISEESSNAATAVPWAIVSFELRIFSVAECVPGQRHRYRRHPRLGCVYVHVSFSDPAYRLAAINVSLTFCMGTDINSLLNSPVGQPMAQIFFNSFGQNGTLALWSFVVLVQ
jgi:hypothetical protein